MTITVSTSHPFNISENKYSPEPELTIKITGIVSIHEFKTLVRRALNVWDRASSEIKEFGDIITEGRITQDYKGLEGSGLLGKKVVVEDIDLKLAIGIDIVDNNIHARFVTQEEYDRLIKEATTEAQKALVQTANSWSNIDPELKELIKDNPSKEIIEKELYTRASELENKIRTTAGLDPINKEPKQNDGPELDAINTRLQEEKTKERFDQKSKNAP